MNLTKLFTLSKRRTIKMNASTIYAPSDAFGKFKVKELDSEDFALKSDFPTTLLSREMHVILFYDYNDIDNEILNLWDNLAKKIAGPVIAALNMSSKREVIRAFLETQVDADNAFTAYTGFRSPTILVYRKRQPQAFYNGELSLDAISAWITDIAWKPGYRELDAYQDRNYEGPGPAQYYEEDAEFGDDQSYIYSGEEQEDQEIVLPDDQILNNEDDNFVDSSLLRQEEFPIADPGFL